MVLAKGFFNNFNLLENELEMRKSLWINESATITTYSDNGSGDLLREEFLTVNEFGDWLTYVNKSNNVVQQSVTLT